MKLIASTAATVTSLLVIGGGAMTIEDRYVNTTELDPFVSEYRQQRIWDMEENVEKSDDKREAKKWLKRLRGLINEFCKIYPQSLECNPDYLDDLEQFVREMPAD